MLVAWSQEGFPSERDLFLARAVLQYPPLPPSLFPPLRPRPSFLSLELSVSLQPKRPTCPPPHLPPPAVSLFPHPNTPPRPPSPPPPPPPLRFPRFPLPLPPPPPPPSPSPSPPPPSSPFFPFPPPPPPPLLLPPLLSLLSSL